MLRECLAYLDFGHLACKQFLERGERYRRRFLWKRGESHGLVFVPIEKALLSSRQRSQRHGCLDRWGWVPEAKEQHPAGFARRLGGRIKDGIINGWGHDEGSLIISVDYSHRFVIELEQKNTGWENNENGQQS